MGLARRIADYAKGIFTDSSGNVGVGTTSPNKGGVSRAVTLNTASGGNIIEMCVAEDRKGWVYADDARTVLSAGGNRLAEIQTNGVARIAVDGSGRVTTPAQPTATASWTGTVTAGNKVPANTIQVNIGSHLNSSGRFTAPIAGTYFFGICGMNDTGGSGDGRIELLRNGANISSSNFVSYNRGLYARHALYGYINLAAGDYLEFELSSGSYSPLHQNHGAMTFQLVA